VKRILSALIGVILLLSVGQVAQAFTVTLAWDASPSQDIESYTIYYGTNSGFPKLNSKNVGDVLEGDIQFLVTGTMHYFVITANDWEGRESGPSNEVRTDGIETPDTGEDPVAPGGCYVKTITPDGF